MVMISFERKSVEGNNVHLYYTIVMHNFFDVSFDIKSSPCYSGTFVITKYASHSIKKLIVNVNRVHDFHVYMQT